jgi:glycine oxidase
LQKQPGFSLITQAAVTGFITSGLSISGVRVKTAGEAEVVHLHGGAIVITAGAWSQQLLEKLSLQTAIQPVKGQMLLYKFPKPPIESIILNQGKYLIPRQDGHLLVGSTLEYAGFDKTSTSTARQALSHSAVAMLPALEKMEFVGQWAGLRPGSAGGVPYIGRLEPYSNFYINAGQFRNGLVLAPASARLTTDIVLGGKPEIDPAPYDLGAHRQDKSAGFEEKQVSTQAPASSSGSVMT